MKLLPLLLLLLPEERRRHYYHLYLSLSRRRRRRASFGSSTKGWTRFGKVSRKLDVARALTRNSSHCLGQNRHGITRVVLGDLLLSMLSLKHLVLVVGWSDDGNTTRCSVFYLTYYARFVLVLFICSCCIY
jgi:hypothetical protein